MKKVWLSGLIALVIIGCALYYDYHNRKELKAYEEHIAELTAPRQPSVTVAAVPVTEVDFFDEPTESNPLNLNDEALEEEECCPDKEDNELYSFHAGVDTVFEGGGESAVKAKTVQLTGDALLRQILTKEFGDDPEIDRYIALSHRIGDGTHKGLETMLEWARLECKFNWSQDAQDLYNDFAELAENPELVTEFSFR